MRIRNFDFLTSLPGWGAADNSLSDLQPRNPRSRLALRSLSESKPRGGVGSFLPFLTSAALALSCAAAAADPVTQLRSEVDQVLAVAYSGQGAETLSERVRPLLEKNFSFELVTRQAIGPGWRQFTPNEQQKVTDLFTRLVIRIYAARVVGTQRPTMTYGKLVTLAADRCEIPTQVAFPNGEKPYSVVYRMINLSGSWRIYDVLIEGVSFVANYRAQFDQLVQRGGAAAVIKSLEAKLAEPVNPNS